MTNVMPATSLTQALFMGVNCDCYCAGINLEILKCKEGNVYLYKSIFLIGIAVINSRCSLLWSLFISARLFRFRRDNLYIWIHILIYYNYTGNGNRELWKRLQSVPLAWVFAFQAFLSAKCNYFLSVSINRNKSNIPLEKWIYKTIL